MCTSFQNKSNSNSRLFLKYTRKQSLTDTVPGPQPFFKNYSFVTKNIAATKQADKYSVKNAEKILRFVNVQSQCEVKEV